MSSAFAAALLTVAALTAPPSPHTDEPPPPGSVRITAVAATGSGCRPGTTAVAVSPDHEAFTVTYSDFLVEAGGPAKRRDHRSCAITLRVQNPPGHTFAVTQVDYRGFAHLELGATGAHGARYHFPGHGAPTRTDHALPAGHSDAWHITDHVAVRDRVYGPCGRERKFTIDAELTVRADNREPDGPVSVIAMDSTDGEFGGTYHLSWRRCPDQASDRSMSRTARSAFSFSVPLSTLATTPSW